MYVFKHGTNWSREISMDNVGAVNSFVDMKKEGYTVLSVMSFFKKCVSRDVRKQCVRC
jgi:hypothetical protein